jgi:hypothetical protein
MSTARIRLPASPLIRRKVARKRRWFQALVDRSGKYCFGIAGMNDLYAHLAVALRDRLALIADQASRQDSDAHLDRLKEASNKITALQRQLPQPIHPQLAHYLQRCSYQKALAFLESASPSAKR